MVPADEDFIVYSMIKSFGRSQWGRRRADEHAFFNAHRLIVLRMLKRATVRVLCDPQNANTILAWAMVEGHDLVHYVLAKKQFHTSGDSGEMMRALLADRWDRECRYSHELVELRRAVNAGALESFGKRSTDGKQLLYPESWWFDPYALEDGYEEALRVAA